MISLEAAAESASFETQWPQLLESIISRLDLIIRTEFPIPATPPQRQPSLSPPPLGPSSQESTKENAPPIRATTGPPPPPLFNAEDTIPDSSLPVPGDHHSQDPSANSQPDIEALLPLPLAALYSTILKSLKTNFATHPPQTIQRLAELILQPKRQYNFLPSYLRAVDRVVNVQSTTKAFPVQSSGSPSGGSAAMLPPGLPNGTANGLQISEHPLTAAQLGSDESLGGALLTPIPWLLRSPQMDSMDPTQTSQQSYLSNDSQNSLENGHNGLDDDDLLGSRNEAVAASTERDTSPDRILQSESTEIVEGPRGAGRIETVSVGFNGTLTASTNSMTPLRARAETPPGDSAHTNNEDMEVLIGLSRADSADAASLALSDDGGDGPTPIPSVPTVPQDVDEDTPHARGPSEIGAEDIGVQDKPLGPGQRLDLDAAAGRTGGKKEAEKGDQVMVDADGRGVDEQE